LQSEIAVMNDIVPATPHDLSFLGLFLQADPIVKGVMILLVLASLGCWTIAVEKVLRFRNVRRQARTFELNARSDERLHPQSNGTSGGSSQPGARRGAIRTYPRAGPSGGSVSNVPCGQLLPPTCVSFRWACHSWLPRDRPHRSAGHRTLDQAALATASPGSSLPPAPTSIPQQRFTISVPLRFNLR
jgi:hypothetical protein